MKRSRQLIDTIKKEQIRPLPRWRFVLQRSFWIAAFTAAVILGGLAFSIILLAVQQAELTLLSHLRHSRLELFLSLLPFVWLASLALALLLALVSLRRSPRGYKLAWPRLAFFSVALSVVVGTAYFLAGGAQQLESAFALHASWYQGLQQRKARLWSAPDAGLLAGVLERSAPDTLLLRDFAHRTWTIDHRQAFAPPSLELLPGDTIKLLGEPTGPLQFRAAELRPWGGPGAQGGNRNRRSAD